MAGREIARYECDGGEVTLTEDAIRNLISTNPNVTDREMMLFAAMCEAHRLNPFIREAHLIKYGDSPATMVVGKDVFTKRAAKNPRFRGFEAGVTLQGQEGRVVRREGSMTLDGEELVGGWCKVHVDGYDVPMFDEVGFDEYAGRRKDGQLSGQWARMPATMIRKVAIVHALREAFPEDFEGLYDSAEMNVELTDARSAPQAAQTPPETRKPDPKASEPKQPPKGGTGRQGASGRRQKMMSRCAELEEEFVGAGGNPDAPADYMLATFGTDRAEELSDDELERYGRHLAAIASQMAEQAEEGDRS